MLVISVHSCSLYRSSAQSVHTFDTSSEYASKLIRHNYIDVGTSIIKRVCKVYVSERMSDCPGVGGRNRVATDPSCLFSMTFQDLFWGVFQEFPGPYMLLYCWSTTSVRG